MAALRSPLPVLPALLAAWIPLLLSAALPGCTASSADPTDTSTSNVQSDSDSATATTSDDAAALALISHWDWSTDDNADDPSSIDSGDDLNGVEKTKKFGKGKPKPMSLCQYNVEVCIKQGVGALFGIEASALGAAGKYSFAKRVGDIERYNEITARAAANVKEATGQAVSEDVLKRYRKQFNFRNWALSTARKMATATGVGAIVVSEATAVAYGVACTESIRKEPLMCPNQ